jgi:hypothetical protein
VVEDRNLSNRESLLQMYTKPNLWKNVYITKNNIESIGKLNQGIIATFTMLYLPNDLYYSSNGLSM